MSDESRTIDPVTMETAAMQRDEARQEAEAQEAQRLLEKLNSESENAPPKEPELSEADARKAHEEAEAKRREAHEKAQQAREDEIQFAWERAVDLPEPALIDASVKRLGVMTERLTRRNMKICVTESIRSHLSG